MQVQIKLLLSGGHTWQFRCDEDDPIVFGLVSALPGSQMDENLPPDGLIQVESSSGERLFLTRSSLVSLEIRPDTARSGEIATVANVPALPPGAVSPAPFALIENALSQTLRDELLQAAEREGSAVRLPANVLGAVGDHVAATRGALGVSHLLEARLDMKLVRLGDRQVSPAIDAADAVLNLLYVGGRGGKAPSGGVRLFDTLVDKGRRQAGRGFRDVEIPDNALLIFPGFIVHSGLPTRVAPDGSMFAVQGALRRGASGA